MKKKALIVQGGGEGHEPVAVANVFREMLVGEDFDVELSDTLDSFLDAVTHGVGIAGIHAGMCDAFHDNIDWRFMTGPSGLPSRQSGCLQHHTFLWGKLLIKQRGRLRWIPLIIRGFLWAAR